MVCFVVPCYSTQRFSPHHPWLIYWQWDNYTIAAMLMKQNGWMHLNKTHKSSTNHWIGKVVSMSLPVPLPCWLPGIFSNKQDKHHHVSHKCRQTIHAFTCSTYIVGSFSFRPCIHLLLFAKWMWTHYGDCTFLSRFHWQSWATTVNAERGFHAATWLRDSSMKTKSRTAAKPRDWVWIYDEITLKFDRYLDTETPPILEGSETHEASMFWDVSR